MNFKKVFLSRPEILLISLLLFVITNETKSQRSTDNLNMSFGINSWDPVHIKVDEKTGSVVSIPIRFTAINSTYYPFKLLIDFTIFENLSPRPSPREISISHGINNLYTLSIHVPGKGYSYKYSYGYWLSPSDENLNGEYPYLVPLKEGKMVIAKTNMSYKINNSFIGRNGDTIYAMRRGLITAVPHTETMDFRLSRNDCLEVLHGDGTYMIYHNISKEKAFTSPGKIVLPGQPIGLFSDSLFVRVSLVKVSKTKNLLEVQPINYVIGGSDIVTFNELDNKKQSIHPREIITKELTGKELKNIGRK